jgi:serine/threonine protein kinase
MDRIKSDKYYVFESELGRGGMATVYLAHDSKFDTNVAIKVLNKEFAHNENIRKRFLAEAKNMFKMSHSNIVKVTDLIEENDTVAFVMEYIDGETLKEYLDRKGKLKDDEINRTFSQMLDAVGYVHEQNLVHRDIKPSNFMLDKKGKVKLMDFGIAKTLDSSSVEYDQTTAEVRMGTPRYMSPEQVKCSKDVEPASDIYSLGVLLWQMVMGVKPYEDLSQGEIQSEILREPLGVTNSMWDSLIQRAIAKEIALRYSTSFEFKMAIQSVSDLKIDESDATIMDITVKDDDSKSLNDQSNIIIDNSQPPKKIDELGIEFIWVEEGSFDMGSSKGEAGRMGGELLHSVSLSGYYMAIYPVTQAQWAMVMGSNPSYYSENGTDRPVEMVSWNDCELFIEKINKQLGSNYRLPTEAEWEFAARGGLKSRGYKYSGSNIIDEVAWYEGNSCVEIEKSTFWGLAKWKEIQCLGTHRVGQKKPNELGIYDMSGNVWEWCADWYGDYPTSAQTNPKGPSRGSYRVLRGGSWRGDAQNCRSAGRTCNTPGFRYDLMGFRLVSPK